MRICRDCLVPMTGVMSFSKDKREKFDRCPNVMMKLNIEILKTVSCRLEKYYIER